jgi:hypothetical protein
MGMDRLTGLVKGLAITSLVLGASGCVDYAITTTLHPDGGGFRDERVEVTKDDELGLTRENFAELMSLTEDRDWVYSVEVDSKGDTTFILQRQTPIRDLGAWSELDDEVTLAAASSANANGRVGYVRLGDVRFRNQVEVDTGTVRDGRRSFTYKETFYWEEVVDAIVEMFMTFLSDELDGMYPNLPERQRGEIVGIARANLWTAFEEGLLDDWEDRIVYKARDRTTEQAIGIVRTAYPDANDFFLRNLLQKLYMAQDGFEEELEDYLISSLPGINLALNVGIEIRLNMPGTVVNSNHHETDGNVLIWEFGPLDAAVGPVEIFAESVVGG